MSADPEMLKQAAEAIRSAEGLVITAGAGMGGDSGLPDFRGKEGFWGAYPPFAKLGLSFEELANPVWFERDPAVAWGFYGHRFELYRRTTPHEGFAVLRRWAAGKDHGCFVFTSNVDGHFQKAGFAPERVVECHGSIHHLQCADSCTEGDVLKAQITGGTSDTTISVWKNGVPLTFSYTRSCNGSGSSGTAVPDCESPGAFTAGEPGIGVYDNADDSWSTFGLTDFSATDGAAPVLSPPANLVACAR